MMVVLLDWWAGHRSVKCKFVKCLLKYFLDKFFKKEVGTDFLTSIILDVKSQAQNPERMKLFI